MISRPDGVVIAQHRGNSRPSVADSNLYLALRAGINDKVFRSWNTMQMDDSDKDEDWEDCAQDSDDEESQPPMATGSTLDNKTPSIGVMTRSAAKRKQVEPEGDHDDDDDDQAVPVIKARKINETHKVSSSSVQSSGIFSNASDIESQSQLPRVFQPITPSPRFVPLSRYSQGKASAIQAAARVGPWDRGYVMKLPYFSA
ncbi:hypothetical protein C8J56DRAFT_1060214 [Mycena floridula]|nr:hypothetical protein C8J56DRAFT_1065745 [Mycena floridula]KAJ7578098.1 hypothetical protein C8J56DRAFT_1060214 [Mycena floridula]